jgi:Tfp pilus assembly protein PilF
MEERHQQKSNNLDIPLKPDGLLNMIEVETIFKSFINGKNYREAINYLNNIKNDTHLVDHLDILKLHDLYIEILLIIEDYKSLENILKSKAKYIETKKEQSIHQFYLAICYEGLGKINEAILALEKIEDTISNQNLINKYLKLALLYLQIKDIQKSKKAYEHAIVFDRQKQNDIFMLVESDIQFYERNYIDSMKIFEDFFIKTKRRLSYLNRFIRISLALNRQNDAYEFYKRYKDEIINHESVQVKLTFFNSAIEFLKTIDQDEYIEANNYLSILNQREVIDFDDFDYYQVVLKHLKKHKIYQLEREIIRDLFIDLNQTNVFKKLVFLEVKDAELHIYHFSKDLLLEKTIENNHLITDDILSHNQKQTYNHHLIENFIFVDDGIDYIFVEHLGTNHYILTYINETQFDLAKKLTILSKHLLMDKFNDLHLRKKQYNQFVAINTLLSNTEYGLIKISANQVYVLNDTAKTLLGINESVITFNTFQKNLEPVIYIDDLYHQKAIDCQYKDLFIRLNTHLLDDELFVLVSLIDNQKQELRLNDLKQNDETSLMLVDIFNHHEIRVDKTHQAYKQFIKQFEEYLHKYSNQHISELFFEANHLFYILLDTRDKRIPERLIQKLRSEYHDYCDIRAVYHPFNQEIKQLIDKLYEMMRLTTNYQPVILNYRIVKLDNELRHTYLETIKTLINHKNTSLIYHYVKDWRNKNVKYIDVEFNHLDILTDETILRSVLSQNQLEIKFDRLIVNQLIHDLKKITFHSKWILPISNQTIESKKAFNYILRRLDIIKNQQIIFKLNSDAYLNLSKDDRKYLKEKQIDICIEGIVSNNDDLSIYEDHHLVIINHQLFENKLTQPIIQLIQTFVKDIIYNHEDNTLKKADLEDKKVFLVKGDFSGHTDNINQK